MTIVATPRFALSTLAALLVAVTALTASRALGAPAAQHTRRQPVSRASAAAPIVPIFKSHIVGKIVPGKRAVWRLTRIVVQLAGSARAEILTVDCLGCRGNRLGAVRRRGREAFMVTHLLVTGQSRLVIYVRRPGWVGRFKVYTLQPRLRAHRLIKQGCLAVDVYAVVSCAASTQVEYVGPGTSFAPSCPYNPCLAVTRVTGYQETTAGLGNVSIVRESGYLTAWQIALAKPTSQQTSFFDTNEGGPAEAGVAVLQPEPSPSFTYKLIAQSPLIKLGPYFGRATQFPLEQPLKVEAGDVIALTVPTWAPALALFERRDAAWRSSRQGGQCSTTSTQSSDTQVGSLVQYACRYEAAQLTYDAIISPSP